jgi:DNA repair protein RadD
MIKLRDYQAAALASIWDYWCTDKGNPLIVAPCGAGKSLLVAELTRQLCQDYAARVLILTHRAEILEQNEAELRRVWPEAPTGFYSASVGRKDRYADVLFAGIQTVHRRIHELEPFDICIIDECHLLPRKTQTMYGKTVETLKLMNPQCRFVGYTASPYRLDSGRLDQGKGALFDKITYDIDVQTLIDKGYLCEVVSKRGADVADTDGLHKRYGEFISAEVVEAMDSGGLVESACDEIIEYGHNRRAWLVYATGVEHAEHIQRAMQERGIDARIITGQTPKGERADTIELFRAGGLRCLINIDVLTIGFNAPICDLCALLFATASVAKYVQVVGRIMRTHPGKDNALLLDYGGNVERHGPIDQINMTAPKTPGDKPGDAPAKACPSCFSVVHLSAKACPDCGYEFPDNGPNHEAEAYDGAVLASQRKPQWVAVRGVDYKRHKKPGKPDSVRVEYHCGLKTHKDWLCPEHGGRATQMAAAKLSAWGVTCPRTTDDLLAMAPGLPQPTFIRIKPDGKYERVAELHFESKSPADAATRAPA